MQRGIRNESSRQANTCTSAGFAVVGPSRLGMKSRAGLITYSSARRYIMSIPCGRHRASCHSDMYIIQHMQGLQSHTNDTKGRTEQDSQLICVNTRASTLPYMAFDGKVSTFHVN